MKKGLRTLLVLFVLLFAVFPVFAEDATTDNDVTMPLVQSALSSPDYLVTAGDVYTLAYYANGASVRYTIAVDISYKVRVANLGIIDAKGKTFLELKSEVEEIVSRNFPMSAAQLVLTTPATYKVTLKGEVSSVHETTLSGMVRLSALADGGNSYSSTRFLSIEDLDGNVTRYDLFLARRFGDMDQNPYVRPGDTIWYERVDRRVSISGAVERPGTYELLPGENLTNLVDYYAGGFDTLADTSNITLSRSISNVAKSGDVQYLSYFDYEINRILVNKDSVYVGSLASLRGTIFVQGAVAMSIDTQEQLTVGTTTNLVSYLFEAGETYVHFARTHRGWFTDVADYERAYVNRNGVRIGIDLYRMVFDPEYEDDLTLKADDILVVPFKQFFVTVAGAVTNPGRYAYVPDRTWDYYVSLAGGYNENINSPETIEIVTVDGKKLSVDDYILPETTITAPSLLKVTVQGEVNRHREILLHSSLTRLSSIIDDVKTSYSSTRFVTVKDKDGNVNHYDFFLKNRFGDMSQDPYLKDGDIITLERVNRRVTISGAVERPGTYELRKGENLRTLVFYYGDGLDILANTDSITLSRTLSNISKSGDIQYLKSDALDGDYELKHLDSVSIGSVASLKKTIFVQGAVGVSISESVSGSVATTNLSYQFETGETYNHFVKSHKTWFTDVSDYERTYVSRKGEKISIDLYSMLFDPEYENDLELMEDDILVVPFKQFFVTVSGAVKIPGRYAYVPDRTWDYYVGLAGGFDAELNSRDAVKITDNLGNEVKKAEYITPETTIDALKNSFSYKFNKVFTPLMSVLSIVTSTIVLINYFSK